MANPRTDLHLLIGAAATYLVLAIAATWPLVLDLGGSVSPGTDEPATVPYASAWALWWTADRLPHGLASWWDAPIFHPQAGVFAWSEAMPLLGVLAAPLRWLGAGPITVLNVVLLGSLTANGLSVFGLGRLLRLSPPAALAGGAVAVLLPVVHAELGVPTLVPIWPIVGVLAAMLWFVHAPSLGRGALLGAAVAAAYLTCSQYGLFTVIATALAGGWLIRRELVQPRVGGALLLGAVVAGLLIAPLALAQRTASAEAGLERSETRALKGSAHAQAWWRTPWTQAIPTPTVRTARDPGVRSLFPGTAKLGLALLGVIWGMRREDREVEVAFVATFALVALMLSLGPRLAPVYALFRDLVPGYAQVRSLWRFGVLAHVGVAVLTAFGVHALIEAAERRGRPAQWGAATLVVLAVVELWPGPVRTIEAPSPDGRRQTLIWAVAQGKPLAFLPLRTDATAAGYEESAAWMVLQPEHGRPTVNGYSSYFPPDLKELFDDLADGPSRAGVVALGKRGICRVVVRSSWRDRAAAEAESAGALRWVAGWPEEGYDAYEVTAGGGCR